MKTKTTITPELCDRVEKLAAKGFNNAMIAQALRIGKETLSRNTQLKQAVQSGKLTLSKQITETVLATLEDNPAMQALLIKRLCLFNPIVNIKRPTNEKDALQNIAAATKAYANGEINESQLRTIEAVSNSYLKGSEVVLLEERIAALEAERQRK